MRMKTVLLTCLLPVAAAHAENASIAYTKLVKLQAAFEALPAAQRDKISFITAVTHSDTSNTSPIHLWVDQNGQHVPIKLTEGGALSEPVRQDWLAADPMVETDQPKHTLALKNTLAIVVPGTGDISAAYLVSAAQQAQAAISAGAHAAAGFLAAFATPTITSVEATLIRCCGEIAVLQNAQGATSLAQSDKTKAITVPLSLLAANPAGILHFSAAVQKLEPGTD